MEDVAAQAGETETELVKSSSDKFPWRFHYFSHFPVLFKSIALNTVKYEK